MDVLDRRRLHRLEGLHRQQSLRLDPGLRIGGLGVKTVAFEDRAHCGGVPAAAPRGGRPVTGEPVSDLPAKLANIRKRIAWLIVVSLVAVSVLATPDVLADQHRQYLPSDGHGKLEAAPTGWKKRSEPGCGFLWLGCRDTFYSTDQNDRPATFYLGDMQGVFKFRRKLPTSDITDGKAKWEIYEKRSGRGQYQLVQTYRPGSQSGRKDWWSYSKPKDYVELDGNVKIVVTRREGTIGVSRVELEHRTGLPEHMGLVESECINHELVWSPQAIRGALIGGAIGAYVTALFDADLVVGDSLTNGSIEAGAAIGLAMAASDENLQKIAVECTKKLERTRHDWLRRTRTKYTPSHHYYVIGDLSYYNDCKYLEFLEIEICPQRRR